jgi:hypothetical protein
MEMARIIVEEVTPRKKISPDGDKLVRASSHRHQAKDSQEKYLNKMDP